MSILKKIYANKVNKWDEIEKLHAKAHSKRNLFLLNDQIFI